MTFPQSNRVVFHENPLAEVVCQLRFPPVLAISSSEPAAFQDRIRPGYPLYEREDAAGVPKEVAEVLGPLRVQVGTVRHQFVTEDSARTIALTRDFLAVTEHAYHRWEEFKPEIEVARAALESVYKPAFYSRIGLRYIDVIDRSRLPGLDGEPWSALIKPMFLGVMNDEQVGGDLREMTSVALINVQDVQSGLVRVQYGLKPVPADEGAGHVYVFDADFYTEQRSKPSDVTPILDAFNRLAGNLWRWAITPRLSAALQPEPIPG